MYHILSWQLGTHGLLMELLDLSGETDITQRGEHFKEKWRDAVALKRD